MRVKRLNCPSRVYILRDCLNQVRSELSSGNDDAEMLIDLINRALLMVEDYENDDISLRAYFWDKSKS
jgi:hypothetical protein